MISAVDYVQRSIDLQCTVTGDLIKGKCSVIVDVTPGESVAVDFDHCLSPLGPSSRRCDFLYVAADKSICHVVPLELTANIGKNLDDAFHQLEAGAKFAQSLIPLGLNVRFCPAFIAPNLKKHTRELLRRKRRKIGFHKTRKPISWFLCGVCMSRILTRR